MWKDSSANDYQLFTRLALNVFKVMPQSTRHTFISYPKDPGWFLPLISSNTISALLYIKLRILNNFLNIFKITFICSQTSLLSSLPLLLDQSHLTDVTLSSEGRSVRAHRVVLSACSSFFSELFRTLEPPFHPVIVLPGTSFGSLVAVSIL